MRRYQVHDGNRREGEKVYYTMSEILISGIVPLIRILLFGDGGDLTERGGSVPVGPADRLCYLFHKERSAFYPGSPVCIIAER